MNIERFRRIIQFSSTNRADMEALVKKYYSFVGMNCDQDVLNIMQIVRPSFQRKGFLVMEMPFADKEIGAFSYKGDALGYLVLNSSLPKVNVNFALCHEVYHVLFQKREFRSKLEFASEQYYEQEEELSANLFAGTLLMPETGFRFMYQKFKNESNGLEEDTLIRLMNYYQAPYMAVLIRCYELELSESSEITEDLLNMDSGRIKDDFSRLWLDVSILDATQRNDYPHLEAAVERFGWEYIQEGYTDSRTLELVLRNIRMLYSEIKGE
ncbi:MAG: ImmA/IrrE family metallo-endopeptidase [Lachnospiraceae bacterium]|nr:ImmA/IrrE family metallo-endopeptidase [Lachnospiraceae bacterium]